MRLATIDVGTNTVLLLVADVVDGRLAVVADQERFARLGEGVDRTGLLADEAMDRVLDRLRACRDTARELDAGMVVVGATSASRDAGNTQTLIDRVRRELGLEYTVLSGETEAALSFRGAMAALGEYAPAGPALVVDVGGGSTEFVAGRAGSPPTHRLSVDVGSVRLAERFFPRLPAPADAVASARAAVASEFARTPENLTRPRAVVAVAGTARVAATLALADSDAPSARPRAVTAAAVRQWADRLLGMSAEDTLAMNPRLMAGREDVAGAGLLILSAALDRVGAGEFVFSRGGLRHGLALAAAEGSL